MSKPKLPVWVLIFPVAVLAFWVIGYVSIEIPALLTPLMSLLVIGLVILAGRAWRNTLKAKASQVAEEAARRAEVVTWVQQSSAAARPRPTPSLKSVSKPETTTLLLLAAGAYYAATFVRPGLSFTASGEAAFGIIVIVTISVWRGWKNWRLGVLMSDTPTSPPHAVAAGRAETTGIAALPPRSAGLGHDNAAWCRYQIEQLVRSRRSSTWVKRAEITSDRSFYVTDTDGAIAVLPDGADVDIKEVPDEELENLNISQMQGLAGANPVNTKLDVHRSIASFSGTWRVLYASIREGEEITVYGPVLSDAWNEGEPAFRQDSKTPGIKGRVHFAPGGVTEREKRLTRYVWVLLAAPTALPLVAPALAILAAGLLYPAVAITLLLDTYNRLVALSNQIDSTEALIDTVLTRRADLIGNLQATVAVALEHELEIQARLATARSYRTRGTTMSEAADVRVANELRLLAERYPSLQTEKNTLKLMQEIVKSENLVAASRNVHNQAVALMRTRMGTFPYKVFASKFKDRAGQYFLI